MALRITRAADPIKVERINMVIYAAPGLGKTSLAFTADAPLLLDFDRGSYRAANRQDVVQVESWADVAGMTGDDLAPFKTVIVDTAGRALDTLAVDITLAVRWGCSGETVRQMCASGRLPAFRVGRMWRIPAAAVEEYECGTIGSDGSRDGSSSHGQTTPAPADVFVLRPTASAMRSAKPAMSSCAKPRPAEA